MTKAELTSKSPSDTEGVRQTLAINQRGNKDAVKAGFKNDRSNKVSKELDCLSKVGRLTNLYGVCSPGLLYKLVDLIPSAFQFSQITCARITTKNMEFQTDNFYKNSWSY